MAADNQKSQNNQFTNRKWHKGTTATITAPNNSIVFYNIALHDRKCNNH